MYNYLDIYCGSYLYMKSEKMDVYGMLSENAKNTLKKLDISLKKDMYSFRDYDHFAFLVFCYYRNEDDMSEEELKNVKSLSEKNVTEKEYNDLLNEMDKIEKHYHYWELSELF